MRHIASKLNRQYIAPEVKDMATSRKQVINLAVQEIEKSVRAMEISIVSDNKKLKSNQND